MAGVMLALINIGACAAVLIMTDHTTDLGGTHGAKAQTLLLIQVNWCD